MVGNCITYEIQNARKSGSLSIEIEIFIPQKLELLLYHEC